MAKTKVNIEGLNETSVGEMKAKVKRDKQRLKDSSLNEHNAGELQASINETQERIDAWEAQNK